MVGTTKAPKAKGDTRPRQDFNHITQQALKAQALAIEYGPQIGMRLTAEFLGTYAADVARLVSALPDTITAHDGSVQLTAAQAAALNAGHKLIKSLRMIVKGHSPDKEVLLAYGVGAKMNRRLVKDIKAGLQKIADRLEAEPGEAARFGFIPEDLAALHEQLAAIEKADSAHGMARATAPRATKQRNATARRILAGIKRIAGAGMMTFRHDATVFANFEALTKKAK